MEKQNLRGEELALARTLAREFATKYNRRRGAVPPDVPQEVRDALRHKFGHASDYALDEYRARFACYYGMMTPVQYATAQALAFRAAMRTPIGAQVLAGIDGIRRADRQALTRRRRHIPVSRAPAASPPHPNDRARRRCPTCR